jgi:holo-[acyl-carrier protein] synthase
VTAAPLSVGIDLVEVARVAESIAAFGDRYVQRVFTDDEIAYARSAPDLAPMRFAARFAAKEAAKKALGLADAGIGWRDLEVVRAPSGAVSLALHGAARFDGTVALSISHEGGYATAVVVAQAPSR